MLQEVGSCHEMIKSFHVDNLILTFRLDPSFADVSIGHFSSRRDRLEEDWIIQSKHRQEKKLSTREPFFYHFMSAGATEKLRSLYKLGSYWSWTRGSSQHHAPTYYWPKFTCNYLFHCYTSNSFWLNHHKHQGSHGRKLKRSDIKAYFVGFLKPHQRKLVF